MTGCDTGRIAVWDRCSGQLLRRFKADHHIVNCVASHPRTQLLASSGIDPDVKIWSLASTTKTLTAILTDAGAEGAAAATAATSAQPPLAGEPTPRPRQAEALEFGSEALPGEDVANDPDASSAEEEEDDDEEGAFIPPNVLLLLRRLIEGAGGEVEAADVDDMLRRALLRGRGADADEDEGAQEEGEEEHEHGDDAESDDNDEEMRPRRPADSSD